MQYELEKEQLFTPVTQDLSHLKFGDRLKSIRLDRKLSQSELADLSDLTPAAISQYETNTRLPNFIALKKISISMYISTDFLITGKEFAYMNIDKRMLEIINNYHNLPEESQKQLYKVYQGLTQAKEKNTECQK